MYDPDTQICLSLLGNENSFCDYETQIRDVTDIEVLHTNTWIEFITILELNLSQYLNWLSQYRRF